MPLNELSGGLLLRPSEAYHWPDDDSVLWMGRLVTAQRSRRQDRLRLPTTRHFLQIAYLVQLSTPLATQLATTSPTLPPRARLLDDKRLNV